AHADCDQPRTPLTAKEKVYYAAKFPVLRAAVPKPPAGWQYTDESRSELAPDYTDYMPSYNCGPSQYYLSLGIDYERPMTQADADKMTAAMQAKPDPAKQKNVDALMAEQQALMQKMMAAAQKQDYKAMDALGKQNDALGKQLQAAQADMNAGSAAAMDALQRDRKANVNIMINSAAGDVTCYGSPKPLQVPGGVGYACEAPTTYSSPGEVLDPARGSIVVVFGQTEVKQYPWSWRDARDKETQDRYVQIKFHLDGSHRMVVQNLEVSIESDNLARAESLFKQMNFKPLAALMGH
ncbi:MAG TPA: hypothetical protein VFV77_03425, partial [Gammaproteobacteria bacterium]|nr:hypothetical protein [Gammaproteobacteria bacterium]